jgi:hypothetical protein
MTTITTTPTTPTTTTARFACVDHGILADDAACCLRCGARPYDLTRADHKETVSRAAARALKTKLVGLTLKGALGVLLALSVVFAVFAPGFGAVAPFLMPPFWFLALGVGFAVALVRSRDQLGLVRALRR